MKYLLLLVLISKVILLNTDTDEDSYFRGYSYDPASRYKYYNYDVHEPSSSQSANEKELMDYKERMASLYRQAQYSPECEGLKDYRFNYDGYFQDLDKNYRQYIRNDRKNQEGYYQYD